MRCAKLLLRSLDWAASASAQWMARAAVPAAGITEKFVLSNSEFIVRRSQVSWYSGGPLSAAAVGSSGRRSQSFGTGPPPAAEPEAKPPGPANENTAI